MSMTRQTTTKVIVYGLILAGLVAINVTLAANHGEHMYALGKNHGCNEGLMHIFRAETGFAGEVPMGYQIQMAMLCVDANLGVPQWKYFEYLINTGTQSLTGSIITVKIKGEHIYLSR